MHLLNEKCSSMKRILSMKTLFIHFFALFSNTSKFHAYIVLYSYVYLVFVAMRPNEEEMNNRTMND